MLRNIKNKLVEQNVKTHIFLGWENIVLCNSSLQNVENDVLSTLFGF